MPEEDSKAEGKKTGITKECRHHRRHGKNLGRLDLEAKSRFGRRNLHPYYYRRVCGCQGISQIRKMEQSSFQQERPTSAPAGQWRRQQMRVWADQRSGWWMQPGLHIPASPGRRCGVSYVFLRFFVFPSPLTMTPSRDYRDLGCPGARREEAIGGLPSFLIPARAR